MSWWAIEWRSHNRADGESQHLMWHPTPRLYRTRREARQDIEKLYGYIRQREDLRREPHGWRMPKAVRVEVRKR